MTPALVAAGWLGLGVAAGATTMDPHLAAALAGGTVPGPVLPPAAAAANTIPVPPVPVLSPVTPSPASSVTVVQPLAVAPHPAATLAATVTTVTVTGSPIPYEDLHKHASLVLMPTAYAAHFAKRTGENAEVFMAWYIGTLYNEKGLFIAPLFSLFIGADAKWAILGEKRIRPAFAIGYFGGLGVPFTGGAAKASSLAGRQTVRQAIVHDAYGVLSKSFGPVSLTAGGMYGIKKAFPVVFPMLRNLSYTTKSNPAPDTKITAWGGGELHILGRRFKAEAVTFPEIRKDRPWLVQAGFDGFLGFDFAYVKDPIGYQVLGYYMLPFYRWPDKKRLEKEAERVRSRPAAGWTDRH